MPFLQIEDPDKLNPLADYPEHAPGAANTQSLEVADKLGIRGSRHILGDPADPNAPMAIFAVMPAGVVVPRHAHSCYRMEVLVRGSMTVNATGEVLRPGQVMVSGAKKFYGPHTVGPEGCVVVEIFSSRSGQEPYSEDGRPFAEVLAEANGLTNVSASD